MFRFANTFSIGRNTAMDNLLKIVVVWCTAGLAIEQNGGYLYKIPERQLSYFDDVILPV